MDIKDEDELDIYEATTPKFIRLATGEDIVAELTEVSDKENDILYYHLHNPIKVIYVPSPQPGIYGIAMMQWVSHSISDEQVFTINGDAIITVGNVTAYITKMYFKAVNHYSSTTSIPPGFENETDDLSSDADGLLEQEIEEMESSMPEMDTDSVVEFLSSKSNKKTIH